MPIITFTNSKGGCGKTTAAILLATTLVMTGAPVLLVDADPREPVSQWADRWLAREPLPSNLTVASLKRKSMETADQTEIGILDALIEANPRAFIIIDTEGIDSRVADYATLMAHFVIIPFNEEQQDADAAIATVRKLKINERTLQRPVAFALLKSRTQHVKARTNRHILAQLDAVTGIRIMRTEIMKRDAYSALFTYACDLSRMESQDVNNLAKARENAAAFVEEVITNLTNAQIQGVAA